MLKCHMTCCRRSMTGFVQRVCRVLSNRLCARVPTGSVSHSISHRLQGVYSRILFTTHVSHKEVLFRFCAWSVTQDVFQTPSQALSHRLRHVCALTYKAYVSLFHRLCCTRSVPCFATNVLELKHTLTQSPCQQGLSPDVSIKLHRICHKHGPLPLKSFLCLL